MMLVLVSLPYLGRPAPRALAAVTTPMLTWAFGMRAREFIGSAGRLTLSLMMLGTLTVACRMAPVRVLAWRGIIIAALAAFLMHGAYMAVGGYAIPTPFLLTVQTPLSFFRVPPRLVVVFGFGAALLVAAALEWARRRGGRAGTGVVALVGVLVVATRGPALMGTELDVFREHREPVYAAVAARVRIEGPGPLLELPWIWPGGRPSPLPSYGTETAAMLGSTAHWLPLLSGCFGCYVAPHREILEHALAALPSPRALQEVVDLTHVRWVLLRPEADWPSSDGRRSLLALHGLVRTMRVDGWDLLRVDVQPQRPDWYRHLAAGVRPDRTLLGIPLQPLPVSARRARISLVFGLDASQPAGTRRPIGLTVRNDGDAPWPVSIADGMPEDQRVGLRVRLRRAGEPEPPPPEQRAALPRDVWPGETISVVASLETPRDAGTYEVELAVVQGRGDAFAEPLRVPLAVTEAAGAARSRLDRADEGEPPNGP